jgi:predicted esterase
MTHQWYRLPVAGGVSIFAAVLIVLCISLPARSGQVWLKNGMSLQGTVFALESLSKTKPNGTAGEISTKPYGLINDGMRKYYVPMRHVRLGGDQEDLSKYQTFTIQQRPTSRRKKLSQIGRFVAITPFDELGRRQVSFANGTERIDLRQGVTRIHPHYLTVTGIDCVWEHGIAPTSLPRPILDDMIRSVTEPANPDDRISIARFYLQAGMYSDCLDELTTILTDFPELQDRVGEMQLQARELLANRLLQELRDRQAAGQYRLVYEKAKEFPFENLSATVLRDVRELVTGYVERRDKAEKALVMLGEVQAELEEPELLEAVKPLRATVIEQLDYASLDRLDAFLLFADDGSVPASERLSLAYSGWILGSANATSDLDATLRLWEARHAILQYLQADGTTVSQRLMTRILRLEGINCKTVSAMIPRLPPQIETPRLASGRAMSFPLTVPDVVTEASNDSQEEHHLSYSALLPHGYTPHHSYPTIVALHGGGRTPQHELVWWGGNAADPLQAQRHGFIVIAPAYPSPERKKYTYDIDTHRIVLAALRDARKRFSVDSDRVFLSGHGLGGDAAFDIGMSHPDVFAGVIPISGVSDEFCKFHRRNGEYTSWYVILGELDRDIFERNTRDLSDMMKHRYDVMLAEYTGRGYETYYEEIHRLFEWMKLHRRTKYLKEGDIKTLRLTGNRFFWMQCEGLPQTVVESPILGGNGKYDRPLTVSMRASVGNTVRVKAGTEKVSIWLSPELVDFNERITVYINSDREIHNSFVRPSVEDMLEDFRTRGDRQKLYSLRLNFD